MSWGAASYQPDKWGECYNARCRSAQLPTGTRLYLGDTAVVELTGLRNPCVQLDDSSPGLMAAVLGRDEHGKLKLTKAGVMALS